MFHLIFEHFFYYGHFVKSNQYMINLIIFQTRVGALVRWDPNGVGALVGWDTSKVRALVSCIEAWLCGHYNPDFTQYDIIEEISPYLFFPEPLVSGFWICYSTWNCAFFGTKFINLTYRSRPNPKMTTLYLSLVIHQSSSFGHVLDLMV